MTKLGNSRMDALVDVTGMTPALYMYSLLSSAGGTLTGVFVGREGEQEGASVSYTLAAATATTLTALYNTANSLPAKTPLPAWLAGFVGSVNASTTIGLAGNEDGTITANAGYPVTVASGATFTMGRVAGSFASNSGGSGGGGSSGGGTVAAAFINTAVSVGTSSTSVLAAGAATKIIILTNDSVNTIYVSTDNNAAVLNMGIKLSASTGSVVLDKVVPTGAINAIATGVASNLTVTYA